MATIFDNIFPRLRRRYSELDRKDYFGGFLGCGGWDWQCGTLRFADVIFRNAVELLTDLTNDVTWVNLKKNGKDNLAFAEFKRFFDEEGKACLWRYFRYGYAVIGIYKGMALHLLDWDETIKVTDMKAEYFKARDPRIEDVYIMKSETMDEEHMGDYDFLRPWLRFLDNILNASNTATERMGAFIVASPEAPTGAPAAVKLNPEDKKDMEKEISREYGLLSRQRQIMLLPKQMKFQTINMANLDLKVTDKSRLCILAVADRIKIPANQLAIIDANSSKTLSNGSELKEGDFNKYQSFERLLNETFVRLSKVLGMRLDYTIYNKPSMTTGDVTMTENEEKQIV